MFGERKPLCDQKPGTESLSLCAHALRKIKTLDRCCHSGIIFKSIDEEGLASWTGFFNHERREVGASSILRRGESGNTSPTTRRSTFISI